MPGQAPPHADERELLLAFLQQQRDGIRYAAYGLTDEQARVAPAVSALSLGGLVTHLTHMEHNWTDLIEQVPDDGSGNSAYEDAFRLGADQTLAETLARYGDAATRTNQAVGNISLDAPVPIPKGVPWFPQDIDAWSVRWVVLHLIEETARHAGHADIVRESVDGATMYELMAGAEGWPATEWLQPWSPPTS
jgi:hypothetical protein